MNGSLAVERGFADGLLEAASVEEDAKASADARELNAVRQTEIGLCKSMSRTDARNLIGKIKGTPGAAPDDATHDAGETDWLGDAAGLLAAFQA